MVFTEYDFNGVTTGVQEAPNRIKLLGSQINGYYPHHANANQQKYYNVSLGAYKVIYEYGLVKSIVLNKNVYFNNDQGDIDYWEITDNDFQISSQFQFDFIDSNPPGYPNGYYIGNMFPTTQYNDFLALKTTTNQRVQENISLEINISGAIGPTNTLITIGQFVQIKLIGDLGAVYYLKQVRRTVRGSVNDLPWTFEGTTSATPIEGDISVHFYLPQWFNTQGPTTYIKITDVNIRQPDNGIKGESHTATRGKEELEYRTVTAVVEDDGNIYVGDNPLTDVYVGGIEDAKTDNTLRWSKRFINTNIIDSSNQYELLQLTILEMMPNL